MGMVNSSLGKLLRSLVGEHPLIWEFVIPQAESAYNLEYIVEAFGVTVSLF